MSQGRQMMTKKKRTKTRDILLSIPKEEMDKIGLEVERLMNNEMSFIVNKYIFKYKKATAAVFGWNESDLRQHIMIILWKGVATFDNTKNTKITTYLSAILYYRMGNLSKSCQNQKNSMSRLYFSEELYSDESLMDLNSSEDWLIYSQQFKILMGRITKDEKRVLIAHLLDGQSLTEMQETLKMKRLAVVSNLKSLKEKMEKYLGVKDEKNSLY